MKNIKYFPFERNKYFYGKLLTVDDFETEQQYMNDKRRIINRFLYGTGVVCGMNVVMADEQTISVEPGLALDFSGREIVIDAPAVKKLSMLDGFDGFFKAHNEKQYLYLCLDYRETLKEPVHNVTGANDTEYNKIRESYSLSVTDREPAAGHLCAADFYETNKIIYQGKGIRIVQTVPRLLESGREFELRVTVENMGQVQPIRFTYDLQLECLEKDENSFMRIHFDEENYGKSHRYQQVYKLRAVNIKNAPGIMTVVEGSFELYIGGRKTEAQAKQKITMEIISGRIKREVMDSYYKTAMEEIVKDNYPQSIYLAKLFVIPTGESYLIDFIEPMPFDQYVYNNVLADMMNRLSLKEEKEQPKGRSEGSGEALAGNTKKIEGPVRVKSGYTILDLGIGGFTGQRFFSDDVFHDLGFGNVNIILGQCEAIRDNHIVYYGSPEVFEEEGVFRAELAARVNGQTGSFQIGLRLIEPTTCRYVRVNWTAVKDEAEELETREEAEIFIKPEMLYLNVRESYYLETKFRGIEPTSVNWYIKEENGGTIEQNGRYTAPNLPGIYEVIAQSSVYDELRASIFIVVRDVEK